VYEMPKIEQGARKIGDRRLADRGELRSAGATEQSSQLLGKTAQPGENDIGAAKQPTLAIPCDLVMRDPR